MNRRLLTLAIFLLLGAVINIAVAWGCGMWIDVNTVGNYTWGRISTTEDSWQVDVWRCAGAQFVHSMRERNSIRSTEQQGSHPRDLVPYWSNVATPSLEYLVGSSGFEKALVDARGWPMVTSWCEFEMIWDDSGVNYSVAGAIVTPWMWETRPRALPLRPVWPGFAINTVFYAAILWLLIRGPFVLRRLIRIRRGLCLACGYDLRGAKHTVCPECGYATAQARSPAALG